MCAFFKRVSLAGLLLAAGSSKCIAQKHVLYCIADVSTSDLFNSKFHVTMDYGLDSTVKAAADHCFPDIQYRTFRSVAAVIQIFSHCDWELVSAYTESSKDRFPKLIFKKQE